MEVVIWQLVVVRESGAREQAFFECEVMPIDMKLLAVLAGIELRDGDVLSLEPIKVRQLSRELAMS